jgi:5-methylcytosine-specific restriction endonuclease McrA
MDREINKLCKKHGETSHVLDSTGKRYRCKRCRVEAVDKRRRVTKLKAVEYKGGKCQECGYHKCVDALEFHHTTPGEKDFSISDTGATRSWDKIKLELNKCVLLCSNCHRETHASLRNKNQVVLRESDIDSNSKKTFVVYSPASRRDNLICQVCNKEYSVVLSDKDSRKFCSQKCVKVSTRKVKNRPPEEELKKLLWEIPTAQIAKRYGVADHTVAKWAKAYKIDKPTRGYWVKKTVNKTNADDRKA